MRAKWWILAVLFVGCGVNEDNLRARAAFDLHCDAKAVEIVPIDNMTRGVRACGHQATYIDHCPAGVMPGSMADKNGACTWVLNGDSSVAPQAGSDQTKESKQQ